MIVTYTRATFPCRVITLVRRRDGMVTKHYRSLTESLSYDSEVYEEHRDDSPPRGKAQMSLL